ncbi:ImmA/IrrE family metallo-endopeptidase [Arthrobacter oryzae]|uniref:ImmA/IrrE family metallo-endopeptidase n=1 Tax=Arthrobacter oryzae TaxID=409290 RepID=UPI0028635F79|nr:ImmA/IrrE family metallo-endopeptidase [Arthrobacter oryzae]MDR6508049.1 Zn-dependent peptidase ImmA (M78 family) [Arthrobacter oryzae]
MSAEPAGDDSLTPIIGTVRVARGLTQKEVSAQTGLSQALLSKVESGMVTLDQERMQLLAKALDVPVEGLQLTRGDLGTPSHIFHRKRATLPVSRANQIRAQLDLAHMQIAAIFGNDRPPARLHRTPLPEDGYITPEDVARDLREELQLEDGPLENLVGVLEDRGVAVLRMDLGSTRIDALVSWPAKQWPLVILSDHAPADRQRFTLAHELGHAVMHEIPTENQETEADRFASEFLMPASSIRTELSDVSIPRLAKLKTKWGVSMAALLRRARDLGQISESKYKQMNIEFSKAGYRKSEPVQIPAEAPALIHRAIERRLNQGERIKDIALAASMNPSRFESTYRIEAA